VKILIVSDTHGHTEGFKKVVEKVAPLDLVVHCGDVGGDVEAYSRIAGCPLEIVKGNNDFFAGLPAEKEFMIGKYKVWLVHGHRQFINIGKKTLKSEALQRGADIVMYGHTHKPVLDITPELIAVNPGSLSNPRQDGRQPSYIIMELDRQGEAHFTICKIKLDTH
jgi:putative phosphoesterase